MVRVQLGFRTDVETSGWLGEVAAERGVSKNAMLNMIVHAVMRQPRVGQAVLAVVLAEPEPDPEDEGDGG